MDYLVLENFEPLPLSSTLIPSLEIEYHKYFIFDCKKSKKSSLAVYFELIFKYFNIFSDSLGLIIPALK